ncbi:Adenylate cyclase type 8 [Homalodisca vitripennis]|nr:Adenylate cyclase type 8 [Homalodisca vitripennis]
MHGCAGNMYGGVATPLAFLHQQLQQSGERLKGRPRLAPLRESHRGPETEPLLPPHRPPLPPHKGIAQVFPPLHSDTTRYAPPWPRGGGVGGNSTVSNSEAAPRNHNNNSNSNSVPQRRQPPEPYLKPLPKPPPRASPGHRPRQPWLQRHYSDESLQGSGLHWSGNPRVHSSADEISSLNHSPSISSSDESYSRTTDASPSPSPPPPPQANLQQWLFPSDIQVNPCSSPENSPRASLDYIPPQCYLSNNNPPEVTKTPLQDTTPSLPSSRSFSPGKNGNNNGSRGSGRSSKLRESPRNVHRSNSSSTSSRRTNNSDKIPPSTLLALAACGDNTLDSHGVTVDSYRGDTCGSFEYQRAKHRNKRAPGGSLEKHTEKSAKDNGETTSSNSAKSSMKKDGSSQTDLKMPVVSEKSTSTPGSDNPVVDFEKQIRKLLDEQSVLRTDEPARYVPQPEPQPVPQPRFVPQLISPNMACITELAQQQERSLGLGPQSPISVRKEREQTESEEDEESRENQRFEEEEKRIAEEVERQEAAVRRILEESSVHLESEWSDEEGAVSEPLLADRDSTGYTTDDPALENISMIHEAGLTDAEGALSDVNSALSGGCHDDGDNTSLSSRASSRVFDSDAMLSVDSLSALFDCEYDNYSEDLRYYAAHTTPDITSLANIRSVSESITRNFGQPRSETDSDI